MGVLLVIEEIKTVFLLSRKTMSSFKRSDIRLFEIIIEQENRLYLLNDYILSIWDILTWRIMCVPWTQAAATYGY